MSMEIKHKVAIVIGASHDLGREIEKILTNKGATVIFADNSREREDDLMKKALEKYWHVDILVNIIEEGLDGPVENIDVQGYKEAASKNIGDALHPMQILIPIMRNRSGGAIVNVGIHTSTGQAIAGLSLVAHSECAKDDIIVSLIHPKMNGSEINKSERVAKKIADLIKSESTEARI